MAEIIWSEGFSVGIELMDEEHKRLIQLINATSGQGGRETMLRAIESMFHYAEVHFRDEEDLLRAKNYPELAGQIHDHRHFIEKAKEFAQENLDDPAVCARVNSFLCAWLSHHILEVDMKYKHFLLPAK